MERLVLARHAESEFGAVERVNGDPAVDGVGLTERGREQARGLGRLLEQDQIDLCAVTESSMEAVPHAEPHPVSQARLERLERSCSRPAWAA